MSKFALAAEEATKKAAAKRAEANALAEKEGGLSKDEAARFDALDHRGRGLRPGGRREPHPRRPPAAERRGARRLQPPAPAPGRRPAGRADRREGGLEGGPASAASSRTGTSS